MASDGCAGTINYKPDQVKTVRELEGTKVDQVYCKDVIWLVNLCGMICEGQISPPQAERGRIVAFPYGREGGPRSGG